MKSRSLIVLPLLFYGALAGAAVLDVLEVTPEVRVHRASAVVALKPGYALTAGDVIRSGAAARLAANFGRHGLIELGPGAELVVEQIPFASYAPDLRSVFRLERGYLRIVWKRPGLAAGWPLQVHIGSFRLSLASGEFFFEDVGGSRLICIGGGQATLSSAGAATQTAAKPGACYRLDGKTPEQPQEIDEDSLVGARQQFNLDNIALRAFSIQRAARPARPAPATPPAPPAAAAGMRAPASMSGNWVLTLASHPEQDRAQLELARLREAGYEGVIESAQVRGQQWHRLRIRGLPSAAAARKLGEELSQRLGFSDPWVSRDVR